MARVLFLLGDADKAHNDNHERLPAAFATLGWEVVTASHESVRVAAGELRLAEETPRSFDLIWPLGFGRQRSFFDRMQLLKVLPDAQFAVTVDALTFLHGKHRWQRFMPETHAAAEAAPLLEALAGGGDWVLKPSAGSYGRDVVCVRDDAHGRRAIAAALKREDGGYLLLQRFLPEVESGEQRTLVAGGELIGTYQRLPAPESAAASDKGTPPLANLARDASATPSELGAEARSLVQLLAGELLEAGAGFAAVDTVATAERVHLMEVNVANPGGLATLAMLGDGSAAERAAGAVSRWRGFS